MTYDLKSLKVPNLSGRTLKALVGLLENNPARRLLEFPLLRESGIDRLRDLDVQEQPLYQPKHAPGRAPSPDRARATLEALWDPDLAQPDSSGFHFLSAHDFARRYRSGELSPVQVAQRLIEAIRASNSGAKPINAVINSSEHDILSQARASEARFKAGQPLSVLDGVPVAVKDELDQVPYTTTAGTQIFGQDGSAAEDATVVARLRAAGALLIGKTHMHEIGIGVTGANPHFGVCRNPYDTDHHTGGSSSGSAAAVAAGLCPIALGVDGGGSVRIPAALCGLVGLKPTWSRVSEAGAFPLCWSVVNIGPIGTCVDDVALAYSLIAGPDPKDSWTLDQPPVHLQDYLNHPLEDLRIGIYTPWFNHAQREVVQNCQLMVETLKRQGAQVREVRIEQLDAQRVAHAVIISTEMLTALDSVHRRPVARSQLALDTRLKLGLAQGFTSRDYVKALQVRAMAVRQFLAALDQVDLILTPTTGMVAPRINEKALPAGESNLNVLTELMRFATCANLTGLPALTLPAGYTSQGLPIGLQLIGRPWEEHLLLSVGRALERYIERRRPAFHHSLF